jgi:DNA-binding HxlR family transcriptional regulator
MALLDLLGRRWALRVLWELRAGPMTFRTLREACDDVSPSVLNDRLRELRDSGLVRRLEQEGYGLTPDAEEHAWSRRWARRARRDRRS